MADVQVDSAELQDGTLTVTGAGFTKTTTELFVDGKSVPFTINDQGQIEAEVEDANEVWAVKGDVESDHIDLADQEEGDPQTGATGSAGNPSQTTNAADTDNSQASGTEPYKTQQRNRTPGDLEKDDVKESTSDVSEEELATAGNAGAQAKQRIPEPNRKPYKEGEHLTDDFRTRVENTGVVPVEDLGIGPRDPYPTGNPQDPNWGYRQAHGHEPKRPEDNADPRPIGLEGLERARGERNDDWKRREQGNEQGKRGAQGSAQAQRGTQGRDAGSRSAGAHSQEGRR